MTDGLELGVCLTTEIGMVANLVIYGSALTFIMIKHNRTLSCMTKCLLFVPALEYISVLCYITPVMISNQQESSWACLYPKSQIVENLLFLTQEANFLVVNIFMLKNLSVYVMFRANGEE